MATGIQTTLFAPRGFGRPTFRDLPNGVIITGQQVSLTIEGMATSLNSNNPTYFTKSRLFSMTANDMAFAINQGANLLP